MQPQSYVQTPCPRCGAAAWGHTSQPAWCGSCGQAIAPIAAPPQQQAWAPPPAVQTPQAPPPQPMQWNAPPAATPPAQQQGQAGVQASIPLPFGGIKIPVNLGGPKAKLKIFGIVALAILGGVGFAIYKIKFADKTAKGNISYSSLDIDEKKADPDQMIVALGAPATKWRKDAIWWAVNLQWVKADGTVDLSRGGAQVTYVSLNGVQEQVKSKRADTVKKYMLGPSGVDGKQIWDATDPWEGVEPHPTPSCSIKQVVEILAAEHGLEGDKTVRISFDPQFAQGYEWHVIGEDPELNLRFSWADCSIVK
jgi:hypothetical protein